MAKELVQNTAASPLVLEASTPGGAVAAPKEWMIFPDGVKQSSKGPTVYDGKRAMEYHAKQAANDTRYAFNRRLPIDVNHLSTGEHSNTIENGKAVGWFTLCYEADGAHARDVEWTDFGRKLVESKEYVYTSPTFFRNPDTNELEEMVCIALTNWPASMGYSPLVAADKKEDMDKEKDIERVDASSDLNGCRKDNTVKEGAPAPATSQPAPSQTAPANTQEKPVEEEEIPTDDELLTMEPQALVDIIRSLEAQIADLNEGGVEQESDAEKHSKLLSTLQDGGFLTPRQVQHLSKQPLHAVEAYSRYALKRPPIALGKKAVNEPKPDGKVDLHKALDGAGSDKASLKAELKKDPAHQKKVAQLKKTLGVKKDN